MRAAIFTLADLDQGWLTDLDQGWLSSLARPRGGDWLTDEMRALRDGGVDALVALLTHAENVELDLLDEPARCVAAGMDYPALPIPDRASPMTMGRLIVLLRIWRNSCIWGGM